MPRIRKLGGALLAASLLLAPLALAGPAQAAGSVTASLTEDTFVTPADPAATRGTGPTLRANHDGKFALVKFNVTGIPTGAPVTGATLTLKAVETQPSSTVRVHTVGSTWTEATTWNTRPTPGAVVDTAASGTGVTAVFDVPVTGNGTVSYAMTRTLTATGDSVFASSENTDATLRPTLTVTYGDPNVAPTVNAGADQSVTLPANANLDGTVTDDGQVNPTPSTTWSKVSGPGTVTFGNASAVDTTASFSVAGTYVLRLTADDGGLVTSDDVQVTVAAAVTCTTASIGNDVDFVTLGEDYRSQNPDLAHSFQKKTCTNGAVSHRFELRENESWINDGRSRSEARHLEYQAAPSASSPEVWFSYGFRWSGQWQTLGHNTITQFHAQPESGETAGKPPALSLHVADGDINFGTRADTRVNTTSQVNSVERFSTPLPAAGTWMDLVVRVQFDPFGAGSLTVWRDGTKVYENQSLPIGYNDTQGPYFKHGLYRQDAPQTTVVEFANPEIGTASLLSRVSSPLPKP